MNTFNSATAQHKQILDFQQTRPFDILLGLKEKDDLHLNTRVKKLKKLNIGNKTIKMYMANGCGETHRVTGCLLKVKAVAPAPAARAEGIHRQETDKSENIISEAL